MSPVESPITQVASTTQPTLSNTHSEEEHSGTPSDDERQQPGLPPVLTLELRGEQIEISRETLVAFPESILIAMFPNGLVLNGQEQAQVDFDPACVRMMLDFFVQARTTHAEHFSEEAYLAEAALDNRNIASAPHHHHHPLFTKPVVIVLREELDYYVLPAQHHTKTSTSVMTSLKTEGGRYLQQQNRVFEALLRNISKENNLAEQHLVDILCKAGFSLEDTWNYRALEPKKTCISSLSLVHLQTSGHRMATAQKLMMFYGKPARKCWWDHTCVELMDMQVRLWARRTWTLELALV